MVTDVNIFKKFSDVYVAVYKKHKDGPSTEDIANEQDKLDPKELLKPNYKEKLEQELNDLYLYRLNALREIENYILDFKKWVPTASTKTIDRVRYFINHDCSYKDTKDKFNANLSTIQMTISRAATSLESKLDQETLDLIAKAETKEQVEDAMLIFKTKSEYVKTTSLLLTDVATKLPNVKRNADIEAWNCIKELKFLKMYSKAFMEKQYKGLNSSKLTHLFYTLESNDTYYKKEKELILNFITKDVSLNELEVGLRELIESKAFKNHENLELED
jgi:hypothetical protein